MKHYANPYDVLTVAIVSGTARVYTATGTICRDWIEEQIADSEWIFSGPDGEIDPEALRRTVDAIVARTILFLRQEQQNEIEAGNM